MPRWPIYFYKVHYKTSVPRKGFYSQRHKFWKWQRKPHKRKLSTKTNTAPNATDLREGCRHSLKLLGKTFHGCSLSKTSPDYGKCQHCQVLHTLSCTQVWCKKRTTSGYSCFLLKGARCLPRLDHTPRGLIPHTKGSSYAATTALSAGYIWLKLLFLSWPIIKTKAKSFKEWEENTKQKPQCGYQKYHFCPSGWHCHPGGWHRTVSGPCIMIISSLESHTEQL